MKKIICLTVVSLFCIGSQPAVFAGSFEHTGSPTVQKVKIASVYASQKVDPPLPQDCRVPPPMPCPTGQ